MKGLAQIGRYALLMGGLLLGAQSHGDDFDFGSLSGEFSVAAGAANYHIPIQLPAGVAGMQPELSLNYSSQSGVGWMGLGWQLQGLTSIYRCPKTLAQDGEKGSIHFNANDRYCMGGQRLVAVSGEYGADGTQYHTEIDSYTRITSIGGDLEHGPASWRVETKEGQTLELGSSENSRLVSNSDVDLVLLGGHFNVSWHVARIEDAVGNEIHFSYDNLSETGEIYPSQIDYSGNRVQFVYEDREKIDRVVSYLAGSTNTIGRRLKQLQVYRGQQLIRSYTPSYELAGTTWQSRIVSIKECAGEGSCLPATRFDYEAWTPSMIPQQEIETLVENRFTIGGGDRWEEGRHLRLFSDVDGDGVADIVGFGDHGVDVELASGESFTRLVAFGYLASAGSWHTDQHIRTMADINADGMADVVGFGDRGVYYALSQGHSFAPPVLWIDGEFGHATPSSGDGWRVEQHPRMLADVDGDTLPDVIGFAEHQVVVRRASGEAFDSYEGFGDASWGIERNPRYVADVDGDGRADIIGFANDGVIVAFSEGDHFRQGVKLINGFVQNEALNIWSSRELADINGDGMLDIVGFTHDGVHVALGTGRGFLEPTLWLNKFGQETGEPYATYTIPNHNHNPEDDDPHDANITVNGWDIRKKHAIALADMNGDGRMDIVGFADDGVYASASVGEGFNHPVKIHDGFAPISALTNSGGYDNKRHLRRLVDVNGDGLADIVGFHEQNVEVAYSTFPHAGDITHITTGSGVEIAIDYQSIAGSNEHFTKGEYSELEYASLPVQLPLRVVTAVTSSNGLIEGTNSLSYRYEDLRIDKRGRGPLGFGAIEATNEQNGLVTRTEFEQVFPHTGGAKLTEVRTPDGTLLSRSTTNQQPIYSPTGHEGELYQSYVKNSHSWEYTLQGELIKEVRIDNGEYDDFGNLLTSTITTKGGGETFTTRTVNSYHEVDLSNWHLGRLARSEVTRSQQGGAVNHSASRTSTFEYNAEGLLIREVVEPDDAELIKTTEYQYDRFGNKVYSRTTGAGLSQARESWIEYDAEGRFPVLARNALKQTERYRYHDICGKNTWLQGPNGGVTEWTYDAFCRQTSETRQDGTTTTTDRYRVLDGTRHEHVPAGWPANTERYPLANVHYKYITRETGKAPITVYYDQLGREIRAETVGMNNQVIYQDTEYDNLGQVLRASRRYFAGDPIYWVNTSYDILGRTVLIDAPADHGSRALTKMYYDGLRTTQVDAKGRETVTTKDALDRVIRVDQPEGAFVIHRYDAYDNLIETEDAKGNVVRMSYDDRGRKITMQDPDMGEWSYRYNTLDELVWQRDAEGHVVTMEYDLLGRMTQRSEAEGETVWTYDDQANGIGKLSSVTAPGGYSETHHYDALGRPQSVTTSIEGERYTLTNEYDPVTGQVIRETRPGDFVVENVYDDHGYLIAKRSPVQQVSDYEREHLQGLRGMAVESAREALVQAEAYAADAADFEAWAHTFEEEIAEEADTQEVSGSVEGLQRHKAYQLYTHSSSGERYLESPEALIILRRKISTPIRVAAQTHYKVIMQEGGKVTLEAIDAATWNSTIRPSLRATGDYAFFGDYNADGQTDYLLRHEQDDALYSSEQLERLGQASVEIDTVAEILWDQANDALSAATQLIAIAGRVDDRMRQSELWVENSDGDDLEEMTSNNGYVVYWEANTRDAELRLTGYRQGNGVVTTRDYDPASGHLLTIQSGFEFGRNIRDLEYQYDLMDNVLSRHDRVQEVNESFNYDSLDRLTKNSVHGKLSGLDYRYDTEYEYDLTGNLLYKSDVGRYRYGSARRTEGNAGPSALLSAGSEHTGYQYDRNGNLLNGGGRVFEWTSFNKPQRLARDDHWTEFVYGPDRARFIKRTSAGETTHYIGKAYERIEQDGTVTHKHFIHTDDGVAAIHITTERAGGALETKTRYLHTDALGSVDTITDGFGVVVDRMSYDPFGMRRAGNWHSDLPIEASALTNRGFTGHEHVDEVGIIHMNGRIYDPELGRFLSADPHIQSPNNSQSHNRYSYVLNNPLKYTDPSGYFIEWMMRGVVKFMGRYGRVVFAVVAAYMTGGMTMAAFGYGFAGFGAAMGGGAYGVMAVTAAGAVGGFASGYVTSGTMQGAFRGAAAGAFSALLASAIGNVFADGAMDKAFGGTVGAEIARNTLHGISQGTITAASGGDFKSGFIGAFVGHAVGAGVMSKISGSGPGSILARTMIAAIAGGLASKWGGGKFANGAVSAAFVHLFNNESENALGKNKENKIILFGPGKHRLMVIGKNWHEGTFGVYAHATSDSIFDDRSDSRITMNANEFAEFLKNNGWQEGQNITLIACHSGEGVNSFAKQLSNNLNVIVTAPNDYVWLNQLHMERAVGGSFLGFPRGGWVEFHPQR
ncbi:MAG: FG-GAP-like repeat-containing protein [Candidatus Thiodiazotropha sp.]